MSTRRIAPGPGLILSVALLGFALYFIFAAVQGEYGVLRGVELEAERQTLEAELALLTAEAERMTDRTTRLSDDFLDLDLLDERARAVLGVARTDEVIVE